MLTKCYCATCLGVEAVIVTVEVDLSVGIGIHLVGLPDSAVRESLLRVITALMSYGFHIPGRKIVVNLAPADLRKEGSAYDLAIAIGLLVWAIGMGMGGTTGFAMNLARDMGPRIAHAVLPIENKADNDWQYGILVPGIAPFFGAAAAAIFMRAFFNI